MTRQHLHLHIEKLHTAHSARCGANSFPQVVVARPMTDLCATCQNNSAAIVRSVNLSEEEKSEVMLLKAIIRTHTHTLSLTYKALKTAEDYLMRYPTHTIHYTLVPCTSRQQGSVPFLVSVVKDCPDRSITSFMRLQIQEKGPTHNQLSAPLPCSPLDGGNTSTPEYRQLCRAE